MPENRRFELGSNRAEVAFSYVKTITESHRSLEKKYKSLVRKTPMRIKANGLASTLAFIFSKKKENKQHAILYSQLEDWLSSNDMLEAEGNEFVETIVAMNNAERRFVTNELLAFLSWLRRFVDGMIEGEEDDE